MRNLLGGRNDPGRIGESVRVGRRGERVGQLGFRRQALAQPPVGRAPFEHTLPAAAIGQVEAGQDGLEIPVAGDRCPAPRAAPGR